MDPDSKRRLVPKFDSFKPKLDDSHAGKKQTSKTNSPVPHKSKGSLPIDTADSRRNSRHHREISGVGSRHPWPDNHENERNAEFGAGHRDRSTVPKGTTNDLFIVDRRGDEKNIAFGTLHQPSVPQYRRSGYGKVLGSSDERIDQSRSDEHVITMSSRLYDRYESQLRKARARGDIERKLRRPSKDCISIVDHDIDFISLRASQGQKRKRDRQEERSDRQSSSEGETQHLSSSRIRRDPLDRPTGVDVLHESDTSASDYELREYASGESALSQRKILSQKVYSDPTNCQAWLEFIDIQDQILDLDKQRKKSTRTVAEEHSIAEVKFSMYEKALKVISQPRDKERLIVGMMEECSKLWDAKTILLKYESYLHTYPDSTRLWQNYLNFKETTFSVFRYEEVRDGFFKCLKVLHQCADNRGSIKSQDDGFDKIYAYILLRLTLMMREAGFMEHAVAIWQAALEFYLFRPPETDHHTLIKSFESFWESEVPRIGEEGAEGWVTYAKQSREPPEPKTDKSFDAERQYQGVVGWLSLERKHTAQAKLPGRMIDDVVENDPSRAALFSDVSEVLLDLPITADQAEFLLTAWLDFCHLPPMTASRAYSFVRATYADPFVRNETIYQPRTFLLTLQTSSEQSKADTMDTTISSPTKRKNKPSLPIADCEPSSDTLFAAVGQANSIFDTWLLSYAQDQALLSIDWIRKTMSALVHARIGGDDVAEYFLALELRLTPETARKTAKRLLKAHPESLRLYNAYAFIEYRLNAPEKAQEVIFAAIRSSASLGEKHRRDELYLWHTWIWETLSSGQAKEALEILVCYPEATRRSERNISDDMSVAPSVMLRSQRALTAARDHYISLSLPLHSHLTTDLLLLLSYLSSCRSLEAAQTAFSANTTALSARFTADSSPHELLHQSFARLLYLHATKVPLLKPAMIREALTLSISVFPHNTIFLSLYAWNEARFRIDDRVRSIVNDLVLAPKSGSKQRNSTDESVTPHLFAIYSELIAPSLPDQTITPFAIRSSVQSKVEQERIVRRSGSYTWYSSWRGERKRKQRRSGGGL